MLLLSFFLIISFSSFALEPSHIYIIKGNKNINALFNDYKKINFDSLNHYPMFKKYKVFQHRGIRLWDIWKSRNLKIEPNQKIVFLGQSGDYTVGFLGSDVLKGDAKISLQSRDPQLSHEEKGNELIFDDVFKNKLPKKLRRRYGLWWVRSIIIGNDSYPIKIDKSIKLLDPLKYQAEILFPVPFGFSSYENKTRNNEFELQEIKFSKNQKKLVLGFLNQPKQEVLISSKYRYFVYGLNKKRMNMKNGAYKIYVAQVNNNKITQFMTTFYYLNYIGIKND